MCFAVVIRTENDGDCRSRTTQQNSSVVFENNLCCSLREPVWGDREDRELRFCSMSNVTRPLDPSCCPQQLTPGPPKEKSKTSKRNLKTARGFASLPRYSISDVLKLS